MDPRIREDDKNEWGNDNGGGSSVNNYCWYLSGENGG